MNKQQQPTETGDLDKIASLQEGPVRTFELASLGLNQETERDISSLEIVAIGWNICNSWLAVGATLALSIAQGGSVTFIYGIIACFICVGASALTLSELASVYPTAGGQYHWTSILSPARPSRVLSYLCGILNVYAWIATTAGFVIIIPQVLLAVVIAFNPDYTPRPWHVFLLYLAFNILCCVHNIFTLKKSLWAYDVAFLLSLSSFFVVMITCLARSPTKQSASFVWTQFVNESGWPNGVSFLIGLTSPNFMYAGIDGSIHLAEECKKPARVVPLALMSTVIIGFVTAFAFAIAMLYSIQDFDAVLNTATGEPIYEIWVQASQSYGAGTVFMMILFVAATMALVAAQQTASRLTWALARDNALLGSRWLSRIHPTWQVPVWALIVNQLIVSLLGLIILGSSNVFNAFIGTGLILQQTTYAIPALLLMWRGRSKALLPDNRPFKLRWRLGWAANFVTVAFALVVLTFYDFPAALPVTSKNMNYASAIIGVMLIFAVFNWVVHAHRAFQGPRIEARFMDH